MKLGRKEEFHTRLEEYKMCIELFMHENRIRWTRYEIHLALSSGLITVWMSFVGLQPTLLSLMGLLLIAIIGFFVALTWLFMVYRGYGINDYWQWHLRRIENHLKVPMLFDRYLEDAFWYGCKRLKLEKQPWRRRGQVSRLAKIVPVVFIVVWFFLSFFGGFVLLDYVY